MEILIKVNKNWLPVYDLIVKKIPFIFLTMEL